MLNEYSTLIVREGKMHFRASMAYSALLCLKLVFLMSFNIQFQCGIHVLLCHVVLRYVVLC